MKFCAALLAAIVAPALLAHAYPDGSPICVTDEIQYMAEANERATRTPLPFAVETEKLGSESLRVTIKSVNKEFAYIKGLLIYGVKDGERVGTFNNFDEEVYKFGEGCEYEKTALTHTSNEPKRLPITLEWTGPADSKIEAAFVYDALDSWWTTGPSEVVDSSRLLQSQV